MLTWTIPVYEEGGEILQLLVPSMQRKDDKWRVSVPLFLSRMQSISGARSRSELAYSPTWWRWRRRGVPTRLQGGGNEVSDNILRSSKTFTIQSWKSGSDEECLQRHENIITSTWMDSTRIESWLYLWQPEVTTRLRTCTSERMWSSKEVRLPLHDAHG